jgi:hypothetical protein
LSVDEGEDGLLVVDETTTFEIADIVDAAGVVLVVGR